jgi:hypothetical protein
VACPRCGVGMLTQAWLYGFLRFINCTLVYMPGSSNNVVESLSPRRPGDLGKVRTRGRTPRARAKMRATSLTDTQPRNYASTPETLQSTLIQLKAEIPWSARHFTDRCSTTPVPQNPFPCARPPRQKLIYAGRSLTSPLSCARPRCQKLIFSLRASQFHKSVHYFFRRLKRCRMLSRGPCRSIAMPHSP